jgi:hypothetical protein
MNDSNKRKKVRCVGEEATAAIVCVVDFDPDADADADADVDVAVLEQYPCVPVCVTKMRTLSSTSSWTLVCGCCPLVAVFQLDYNRR